ncbi:unnamed protein product [Adineta ricciae]|uniref:Methyltransferase domain-containing protein n=1 Tax=Adineta ricciae TaxID=249248 RepID=A0A816EG17_ADIRI|nr:unnamed protein product [Adineta ricciae]
MTKRRKSSLLKSQREYDEQIYWNDRYEAKLKRKFSKKDEDDHTDEWYFSYADISDLLKSYLKSFHRQSPVLDIGCGLSNIFDELADNSFSGPFIGTDYSQIVISHCKKMKKPSNFHYLKLDMMQKSKPSLPYQSFGLIIDKATTDGILCNQTNLSKIAHLYEHVSKLLASNGLFILITIKTVDDEQWFEDCLIPSLIRGSEHEHTKFIIHFHRCMTYTDESENGPNVFVIVKYVCKTYSLRSTTKCTKRDLSQLVTVKCY